MAGINIELPAFAPDDLNDPRARRRIVSYLYRLAEQVKYLSTHIDGENMTDDFQQEMVSTASASVRDELSGTLTKFETQIEQNAREISTKASQTEVNALGEEIETASSEFSQTASQLSARVTTADGKASQALADCERVLRAHHQRRRRHRFLRIVALRRGGERGRQPAGVRFEWPYHQKRRRRDRVFFERHHRHPQHYGQHQRRWRDDWRLHHRG